MTKKRQNLVHLKGGEMTIERMLKLAVNDEERKYISLHFKRWIEARELIYNIVPQGSKILEIGIGGGGLSLLLSNNKYTIYGLDIKRNESEKWIKKLVEHGIIFNFCDVTQEKLPFRNGFFDIVLFLEVLEHLITDHPPYEILCEINRVMKNNSYLILSTPNLAAINKRLLLLLGRNPLSWSIKREKAREHLREYTIDELQLMLERTGFEIMKKEFRNYRSNNWKALALKLVQFYPRFRSTIVLICKKNYNEELPKSNK